MWRWLNIHGVGKTFPEMQKVLPILLKPLFSSPASCSLYTRFRSNTGHITLESISACRRVKPRGSYAWLISEGVSLNYLAMFTLVTLFTVWRYTERVKRQC